MPFGRRWFAVTLLLIAPAASAWNDSGHMIAALIAYDQLPPAVRARAMQLLRAHPRFHEDFERQLPRNLVGARAAEQDRWYFAFGATWPDEARRFDHVRAASRDALIARYNHGSWHYINLPTYLRPSDRKQINQSAPSMTWTEGLDDAHLNIVQALDKLTTNWCAPSETDTDRGLAVSWIVHLIGDLHQPLHSTALYAVPAFIHGDRGGNDIAVVGGTNLHALWDGALGDDRRLRSLNPLAYAYALASATEGAKNFRADLPLDFRAWARHEREIAARVAYSKDVRSAVAAARQSQKPEVRIDDAYRAAMVATAQQEIGLAGHRIAQVLATLIPENRGTMCSQRDH
jgi:hypothetical protein